MPAFTISFVRVDRSEHPTVVEAFFRSVDWPTLPREGEGLDIGGDNAQTIESVGYDFDGSPNVLMGRIVLDDLQAAHLRKLGWRAETLPFGSR